METIKPVLHLALDRQDGMYVLVEKAGNRHLAAVDDTMAEDTDSGPVISLNGVDQKIELDVAAHGWEFLSQLDTGTLVIDFQATRVPDQNGIAPLFGYGAHPICNAVDANNQGFVIELGHDPFIKGNQSLFYTVYGHAGIHETQIDPGELPSFCFDSIHPVRARAWHQFAVVASKAGTTGYLDGRELLDRRMNYGKSGDTAFFASARVHDVITLGHACWLGKEHYFHGAIRAIRIFDRPIVPS